jgi:putative hydrolase of the HAD superfamily
MIKGAIIDFNRTLYDPESSSLIPGAIDVLERLTNEGIKLCLISKRTKEERREQISELGLDKYFLDIQVLEDDKSQESFERCVRIMSLNPSEIAVLGDRVKKEIYLGNKLGMRTIWYKSGKFASELPQNKDEEPQYTITRLEEIFQYLI